MTFSLSRKENYNDDLVLMHVNEICYNIYLVYFMFFHLFLIRLRIYLKYQITNHIKITMNKTDKAI